MAVEPRTGESLCSQCVIREGTDCLMFAAETGRGVTISALIKALLKNNYSFSFLSGTLIIVEIILSGSQVCLIWSANWSECLMLPISSMQYSMEICPEKRSYMVIDNNEASTTA